MRHATFLRSLAAAALLAAPPSHAGENGILGAAPDLRVIGWELDDSDPLGGNSDGGLHPGETGLLRIFLSNQGGAPGTGVSGQLFEAFDHPDVEILDALAVWPDLPDTGAPAVSLAPHFKVQVATTRPCRWEIPLRLELAADGGYAETRELVLEMVDPRATDLAAGAARPFVHGVAADDFLGRSVATGDLDGDGYDDLVLGAYGGDGPTNLRSGAGEVAVIYGGPSGRADVDLAASPPDVAFIHGADAGDSLSGSVGVSLATGDLDGDGYDDLVLGATSADGPANARSNAGEVAVIYGGPSRLASVDLASSPPGVTMIYGAEASDFFGRSVAAGDLNGDGFDDLVLGADFADGPANARPNAGEVAVIYGGPGRLFDIDLAFPTPGVAVISGADADHLLGRSVATGDLDADGFDDLVLGAVGAGGPANARPGAGEVAVVYGSPARLSSIDLAFPPPGVAVIHGADAGDSLGHAATGDLDGDGFDDLVLGADNAGGPANARPFAGEVAVIHGGPARLSVVDLADPLSGATRIYGADPGDELGIAVAAGDVDGDGFDDLVLGADFADGPTNARSAAGEVMVIHGAPSRPSDVDLASPPPGVVVIYGAEPLDGLSRSVATGDLDGDGFDDLVLGADGGDGPGGTRAGAGEVTVVPGEPRSRYRHDPVAFAFIDASVGTDLGLGCDDCGTTIPIGFEFDFFGRKFTEVTVSSNGYLTFGGPGDRLPVFCPPRSGHPNGVIAAFWEDLDLSAGGAVYSLLEGTAPGRRLTVEWAGVALYGGTGDATFQVTLFESSNRIVMQYQDVFFGAGAPDNGGTAVVGVENVTGVNGAAFSCFTPAVADGSAVAWRRFASPTVILSDDAESDSGTFTATGLWHREQEPVSACSPAARGGDWSWYYGGATGPCDYDTGPAANSGTLTTQVIAGLPQDARLSFWQRRQTEGLAQYDISRVEVQAEGGGFAELAQVVDESNAWRLSEDFLPPDPEAGVFSSLDLSAHAGGDVEVRFSFDTVDGAANSFLGWMVDNVTIRACPVFGAGGMEGVAAEARATAQPEVICEDGGARLDAVGSYCTACPGALMYQWAEEGAPIEGATGVSHDLPVGHATGTFEFSVALSCPANPACGAQSKPAAVSVVARPQTVGPTLEIAAAAGNMTFHWADVPGAADYVVLSGTDPSVPLMAEVGSAASGSPGLTSPVPSGELLYFQVVGRNPACGEGPQG